MILRVPVIRKRTRVIKGKQYTDWSAYCGRLGKRKFFFFAKTEELVKEKGKGFLEDCHNHDNPAITVLKRSHAIDALNAIELSILYELKMSLSEITLEYLRLKKKEQQNNIGLGDLVKQFYSSIDSTRVRTKWSYKSVIRLISENISESTMVNNLSSDVFLKVMKKFKNPRTYNSVLKRIKAIMNWGKSKGLISISPLEKIEPLVEHYKEPVFFTSEKVEKIMGVVQKDGVGDGVGMFFVLGFFAGIRSAEIIRAKWCDIDIEENFIRIPVPKGLTNGGKPRIVELEPNAIAWIRLFWNGQKQKNDLIVNDPRKLTKWKKQHLSPQGLSWGNDENHNVMRHTYATMHVAAFRNASSTALNLGHGRFSETLDKYYKGLATRGDAEKYWKIYPQNGKN